MAACKTSYEAPALEKGLDILELLADEPNGLSQKAIAEQLNRSVGEIFRMLVGLEKREYIHKRSDDNYELTLRLFDLAHRYPPSRRLLQAALAPMQQFADTTHQSVHLAVLYGPSIMIVAATPSPSVLGVTVRLGSILPAEMTASGRVLLACCHQERAKTWMKHHMKASLQSKSHRAFLDRLNVIRERGYESNASDRITGVVDLSVPVFDIIQDASAALTVPYLTQNDSPTSREQSLAILRDTGRTISAALGGGFE